MKKNSVIIASFLFLIVIISCEKKHEDFSGDKAYLQIRLTDSPASYKAVLIDVQDVLINYSSDNVGWESLDVVNSGIYNLLDYTSGLDTLIAASVIDTGKISQIRLVLGENNKLITENDTIELFTPSAQQSGLKIAVHEVFNGGITYKITLDFDASKSIVKAGNSGQFNLKPVIRAIVDPLDGAIKGAIADSINAVVYAIYNSDSIGTYPDSIGKFFIGGLEEGIYSVYIEPQPAWKDTLIENISVNKGIIANLGKIELKENY